MVYLLYIISEYSRPFIGSLEKLIMSRLIDFVAEDNAIEDTIYHLTRALDNERIDLDRFLKVRYFDLEIEMDIT